MLKARALGFLRDDRGAGTLWGVFWFLILAGFAGLAVDGTAAFQNETMLQATADAAALAAVIDLPREDPAVASAIEYARKNMPPEIYGEVLTEDDVVFGTWDHENKVFVPGESPADAVLVTVRGDPVFATFLRMAGVLGWKLKSRAIAQKFTPQCFTDGLVARGYVDTSGNNEYYNHFCIHGQNGVYIQNGNFFELGTSVSMPDLSMLKLPTDGFDSNPGLREALLEGSLDPRMVDHVPDIMDMLLDPTSPIQPTYIDTSQPVLEVGCKFDPSAAAPGRIYHVLCEDNKQVKVPGGSTVSEIVVVAESQIGIPSGATLEDVIFASRATTSNGGSNLHFSSSVNLGRADDCADGGGVSLFTTQNLSFSSSTNFNGVQIVSAHNVALGSSDEGVKGLAVQAGGNITLSSNNKFGLCNGDDPLLLTRQHYRLVM